MPAPATTITITCPQCKAQLRGPADLYGKRVRCKGCNHAFQVAAASPAPAAARPVAQQPAAAARPAAVAPKPARVPARAPAAAPQPNPNEGPGVYRFASEEEAAAAVADSKISSTSSTIRAVGGGRPSDATPPPYDLTEISLAPRCAHCAQELPSADAVICLYCGYNTQTRGHSGTKRTYDITSDDRMKWRMPAIVCALVALGCLSFICFAWIALPRMADNNPDAWYVVLDALWFQMWGSVFAAFGLWFAGRFAIRRLITQPDPPEIEKA